MYQKAVTHHITNRAQRRATLTFSRVSSGMEDSIRVSRYVISHPWVGAVSRLQAMVITATAMEEKGEFCVAIGPAGILTQLVKDASGLSGSYRSISLGLTEFHSHWLKGPIADELLSL